MQLGAMKTVETLPVHFKQLKAKAENSWKWIISRKAGLLVLASGGFWVIAFSVATTDKVVVGPFSVPQTYNDRGYTSEAMSSAVVQFIRGNESTVSLTQPVHLLAMDRSTETDSDSEGEIEDTAESVGGKHVVSSFDPSSIPDIKVPLTSYSLEALIDLLRDMAGRRPTRIEGEIVDASQSGPSGGAAADPQKTSVLIRYKVEYPEPSYSILGYHWWPRRTTTVSGTLTANGAEDVVGKLALVTADALGRRTLTHESTESRIQRLISRGNVYFGLQDYGRAERMFELANSLKTSGHAYLSMGVIEENQGNYGRAEELYQRATGVSHAADDDPAWALLYWGNLLVREHKPSLAVPKYLLIANQPSNLNTLVVQAAAQNNLGFVYLFKHDWKKAESSFRAAEQNAEQLQQSAQACAYSDGDSNTCDDAQTDTERADDQAAAYLSLSSINHLVALTHYGLARTFAKQRPSDATTLSQEYRASIQADPGYSPAHYQLALIYISQKNYQEAQNELQKAIESGPGYEHAYDDWKALLDRWSHLPGRLKSDRPLNRTLARDYRNWGDTFARAGNPDDASDRYCAAASLDPEYKALCAGQQETADLGTVTMLSQPQ